MSVIKKATGYEVTFTVKTGVVASNALLTLTVDPALSVISGTPSAGSYANEVWTIGDLAVGDEETLVVLVNPVDLSQVSASIIGVLTYDENHPDKKDDTVVKTIDLQNKVLFPVRTLTDSGSPHDVLIGVDNAIKLNGASDPVTLNLGDAAGWIYADGSSYQLAVTSINSTAAVTLSAAGGSEIVDDAGASAATLTLGTGESVIIVSDGTDFQIIVSGGALA